MHKKSAVFLLEPVGSMYLQPYFECGSHCLDPMTSPSYLAKRELLKVSGELAVKYRVARQGDLPQGVRERERETHRKTERERER